MYFKIKELIVSAIQGVVVGVVAVVLSAAKEITRLPEGYCLIKPTWIYSRSSVALRAREVVRFLYASACCNSYM